MSLLVLDNKDQSRRHGPQPGGFEHHGRVDAALEGLSLARSGAFIFSDAPYALRKQLELVHPASYIASVERACRDASPDGIAFGEEVLLYPGSWDAAATSAGAAIRGVEAVLNHEARHAITITRSPGHHAEPEKAMGFCIFSNAALAARYAQLRGERVAVIDLDTHNGNGTEAALAEKIDTLFAEIALEGHPTNSYPYPGQLPPAPSNAVRIGLPEGSRGDMWVEAFERGLLPEIRLFKPTLAVISFGFDCMTGDPLGGLRVSPEDIYRVTKRIMGLGIPVISIVEGGYKLDNLRDGVHAHAEGLKLGL